MKIFLIAPILCCALTWVFTDPYFPITTKAGDGGVTAFEAEWYGKSLERMQEPRLPELAKDINAEGYRILILPTWGNSVVVRAYKNGRGYSLSSRRLDGQAGYDPGKLVEAKDVDLSADDSRALDVLVQKLHFFELPTNESVMGADGEEWIIEGVSSGKYHVVQRWCASSYNPDKRGLTAFLDLSKFLLKKSGLSEGPKNKGHKLI